MFDFWFDLPPLGRALMGIVMIAIAVLLFFFTGGGLIMYGLGIVGVVFLLFSGSGSTKGGYRF